MGDNPGVFVLNVEYFSPVLLRALNKAFNFTIEMPI